jgi:ribosome-binding protein aMBF1 (putative translation factor)
MIHQDLTNIIIGNNNKKNTIKKIIERKGDTSISDQLKIIENNPEITIIPKIPTQLSKELTMVRNAKKMTQKDLANKLNIQQSVYNDIESGKALYSNENKQLINKIERLLGIKFLDK